MRNTIFTITLTCLILFFQNVAVHAADAGNKKALAGISEAKAYFDINVGEPAKLVNRLMLIDRTFEQLTSSGVKPDFVVGFRSTASYFVTKGPEDYILEDEVAAKKKVNEWIAKLRKRGIVVEQCLIAAELHDIDPEDFIENISPVQNGYISMIGYQARGYSYVPMD